MSFGPTANNPQPQPRFSALDHVAQVRAANAQQRAQQRINRIVPEPRTQMTQTRPGQPKSLAPRPAAVRNTQFQGTRTAPPVQAPTPPVSPIFGAGMFGGQPGPNPFQTPFMPTPTPLPGQPQPVQTAPAPIAQPTPGPLQAGPPPAQATPDDLYNRYESVLNPPVPQTPEQAPVINQLPLPPAPVSESPVQRNPLSLPVYDQPMAPVPDRPPGLPPEVILGGGPARSIGPPVAMQPDQPLQSPGGMGGPPQDPAFIDNIRDQLQNPDRVTGGPALVAPPLTGGPPVATQPGPTIGGAPAPGGPLQSPGGAGGPPQDPFNNPGIQIGSPVETPGDTGLDNPGYQDFIQSNPGWAQTNAPGGDASAAYRAYQDQYGPHQNPSLEQMPVGNPIKLPMPNVNPDGSGFSGKFVGTPGPGIYTGGPVQSPVQSVGGPNGPPQQIDSGFGGFNTMQSAGQNLVNQGQQGLPQQPVNSGYLDPSQAQTQNQIYPEPYNVSPFNTLQTPSAFAGT